MVEFCMPKTGIQTVPISDVARGAEGGSQPPQGRLLVGVDLGHGLGWLRPRRLVPAGPEVKVDPVALEFELVDLAFAVVLAAGLEGQDLQVTGKVLKLGQQVSYCHALSVARRALQVIRSWAATGLMGPARNRA